MKLMALAGVLAFTMAAPQQTVHKPGPGVTNPKITKETRPEYTAAAMRARIQGGVVLEAVVDVNGKPTDIKVVRSLDPGLDASAVRALEQWEFKPGTKDGKPVPTLVTVELTFTLRDRPVFDKSSAGVTPPVLVADKRPAYTEDAMREKVEGTVILEGVVGDDGKVTNISVVKSLRPDLDEKAVEAFSAWTFKPATVGRRAVAFRTQVEMTFKLR